MWNTSDIILTHKAEALSYIYVADGLAAVNMSCRGASCQFVSRSRFPIGSEIARNLVRSVAIGRFRDIKPGGAGQPARPQL